MAFTNNNQLGKGRPKNSSNKVTANLKVVLEQLAQDLHQSIDISTLKEVERLKLFIAVLPYLMPKQQEIKQTNTNTDLTWLDSFSENDLSKLLNS